jgi:hypothetical protein
VSYIARIVGTNETLTCWAGRMGTVSRCLVIQLPDGRRVEVEYRPDVVEDPPLLREVEIPDPIPAILREIGQPNFASGGMIWPPAVEPR